MPFVSVRTSSPVSPTTELLSEFSHAVAASLAKPEGYVMVELEAGRPMVFAASPEPCCYVEVRGIGAASPGQKAAAAEALTAICERALGVSSKRVFVVFQAVAGADWAVGGTLFG